MQKGLKESLKEEFQSFFPIEEEVEIFISKKEGELATNLFFFTQKDKLLKSIESLLRTSKMIERVKEDKGFLNIYLKEEVFRDILNQIYTKKEDYARGQGGANVLVEFVSANPTGPLHIGHGRGAVIGDVIGSLFEYLGYKVTREYYINDRGRQIELLGKSLMAKYLEKLKKTVEFPQDGYKGKWIDDMADEIYEKYGKDAEKKDLDFFSQFAVSKMMERIKDDLREIKIEFENFVSEKQLWEEEKGNILGRLSSYIEKKSNAIFFKSSSYYDEKDRVLIKEDGSPTYFLTDIIYHLNKYKRGYDLMVNVWGYDHHGYVDRLKSAIKALNLDENKLNFILYQFAYLKEKEDKFAMSTREAKFFALSDLVKTVGKDAARFFLLYYKPNTPLEFDIELAQTKSSENPLYYIQYAHARCCSILEKVDYPNLDDADISLLKEEKERKLITYLGIFLDEIKHCVFTFQPHKLLLYLIELAKNFHNYYTYYRVIQEDKALTKSRLLLVFCIKQVIKNALGILKIEAPERM